MDKERLFKILDLITYTGITYIDIAASSGISVNSIYYYRSNHTITNTSKDKIIKCLETHFPEELAKVNALIEGGI